MIGLGCMRLSTEPGRDEARGTAVLHAALGAGITLFDTADAYCWNDEERGHNERLIARALASWSGDRSHVRIATKGGLTRPGGRWEPDGRAKHLAAACEASCRALDVRRIDLYQLHVVDPRTPLATSVRALAALKRDGLIASIGLCNVTVGQVEEARRIVDVDAVQVELSVWNDDALLGGVVDYCLAHRLTLLAYRPLGGPTRRPRLDREPVLARIAARHGATVPEVALAWLRGLSDSIVPIPGATQIDTPRSIAAAGALTLTDEDRAELDGRFPAVRRSTSAPALRVRDDAEVVMVMGLPGAGKSTYAQGLTADGYRRLNRDETGGTLRDLLPALDAALASDMPRIVLDNTYVSRQSRAAVVRTAAARGVPIRCIWIASTVEDAQTNAAWRLVSRYGRLPDEAEMKRLRKHDPGAFAPSVLFRYQRELEPPDVAEGFAQVDVVPFERRTDPALTTRALIVWCDDVLLRSRTGRRVPLTPDDADILVERAELLRRYQQDGWRLLGLSWQPDVEAGAQSREGAAAVFARMREALGLDLDVDVEYCPHGAGPPRCWCRKPLPGLGVLLIHRHRLDPAQCLYVGAGPQDPGFARRLGFRYEEARRFFESM